MRPAKLALTTFVVLTLLVGAVSVAGAQMDDSMESGIKDSIGDSMNDDATNFTVRIENVAPTDFYASDTSTGGQVWVTPGAYGIHTGQNPVFTEGQAASVGLEAQAEAGPPTGFEGQPGLIDELSGSADVVTAGAFTPGNTVEDPNDPMGEVPGAPPIAPGGAYEFEVTAEEGQNFSFATMFVPSNDLFFSPGSEGIALWEGGEPVSGDVTDEVDLWDAGTETNQEPGFGPDQAPAQSAPDQGDDEGGVVRPLSTVDDGFEYPSVTDTIQVTVTPQDEVGDGMDGSPVEGVSDELWDAVTQNDGEDGLSLTDLGNAIQEYQDNPGEADVSGVSITLSDLGSLIQYYRTEVA